MSELPAGWGWHRLGDVADLVRGVTYKKEFARSSPERGYLPLLRATNIGDELDLSSELVYVPASGVKTDQLLRVGDIVLVSSSGSASAVGRSARLPVSWEGTFGAFCTVIRTNEIVDPRYLAHFVREGGIRRGWSDAARGTNINNLKLSHLLETPVPVPPLEEQRRIVDVLEDHLSRLEAARVEVDRGLARLPALEAAARLDLARPSSNSVLMTLAEAAVGGLFVDGDWVETRDQDPSGDVRLTQLADVGVGAFRNRSDRWMRQDQSDRLDCTALLPGDIMIARMPEPLARACQVPADIGHAVTAVDVAILRVARPDLVPRWLMWAINGPEFRASAVRLQSGTTRKRISRRNLAGLTVHVPPVAEQVRRVEVVESIHAQADRLHTGLVRTGQQGETLRRALLAAAFAGRLSTDALQADQIEEPADV